LLEVEKADIVLPEGNICLHINPSLLPKLIMALEKMLTDDVPFQAVDFFVGERE